MGFFSSLSISLSPHRSRHRGGHYGSGYYKGGGLLSRLFNAFRSGSDRGYYNDGYADQNIHINVNPNQPVGAARCARCGADVPAGSKFCLHCGAKMTFPDNPAPGANGAAFCPNCGGALPPNARFCQKCGIKLGQ
jgi:ribosomal protein L40E